MEQRPGMGDMVHGRGLCVARSTVQSSVVGRSINDHHGLTPPLLNLSSRLSSQNTGLMV